jgi:glycosyltransferase involved in cell wall biosynthesis
MDGRDSAQGGGRKVSVIVPACMEVDFIERALASYGAQTYQNKELIVVVNGLVEGDDGTGDIAERYANVVLTLPERSSAKAKNAGFKKASGDIMAFLDADTGMDSDLLAKAEEAIREGYAGGKAMIRLRSERRRARNRAKARVYSAFANSVSYVSLGLSKVHPGLQNGPGGFFFGDGETLERIKDMYGMLFDESACVEDISLLSRLRRMGMLALIRDSHVTTSARRHEGQGYLKTTFLDFGNFLLPRRTTRKSYR